MPRQAPLASPYHLFESRRDAGLCCAVAQDRHVPRFIDHETWAFRGTITRAGQVPPDLNLRAAQASDRLTGYHLFIVLRDAEA